MTASTTVYPAAQLVASAMNAGLAMWLNGEVVVWHGPADVRKAWAPTLQASRALLVPYLRQEVWPGKEGER